MLIRKNASSLYRVYHRSGRWMICEI